MKKITYNKLVRDKIPETIEQTGHEYSVRLLDDKEYLQMLKEKLTEETAEFFESEEVEEIADIIEVLYAICEAKGVSVNELEDIRKTKVDKRGAFKDRILLNYVIEE